MTNIYWLGKIIMVLGMIFIVGVWPYNVGLSMWGFAIFVIGIILEIMDMPREVR